MVWNIDDNSLDPKDLVIYKYVKRLANPKLADILVRFIGLSDHLDKHVYGSADDLRKNILYHDKPVFTVKESEQLFAKHATQHGGAIQLMEKDIADKLVREWVNFAYRWSPEFVAKTADDWSPTIFILKELEEDPDFGSLISLALNSVTATLPSVGMAVENISSEIGGPPGAVVGYMIGSVAMFMSILTHISRDQFGQAFILTSTLVPFVGTSMYTAALSGQKFIEKVAADRERLLHTVSEIFDDDAAALLDELIPNLDAVTPNIYGPPLPKLDRIKNIVARHLPPEATTLLQNIPTSIDDAKNMAKGLAASQGLPTNLDDAKNMAKGQLTNLAASQGLPTSIDDAVGGKRLSSAGPSKSKWRTQKRSRR